MQRIFLEKQKIDNKDGTIKITGQDVNHIKNVLRYEIGDKLEIVIDEKVYEGEILQITQEQVICNIVSTTDTLQQNNIYLNIVQGLPKADKMEFIIQKGVELGASEITPLELNRCIVKLDSKTEVKKIERWRKIAKSAAEQSKRNLVPKVNNIYNIEKIFELLKDYDIVFVAYENEQKNTLKLEIEKLKQVNIKNLKIAVIIGPEGGLEEKEVKQLINYGAKSISLGKRILRTETASLVFSSIIMYELENII